MAALTHCPPFVSRQQARWGRQSSQWGRLHVVVAKLPLGDTARVVQIFTEPPLVWHEAIFLALWTRVLDSKIGFRAPVSKSGFQVWRVCENTNKKNTHKQVAQGVNPQPLMPFSTFSPHFWCLPFLPWGVEKQHEERPSLNPKTEKNENRTLIAC